MTQVQAVYQLGNTGTQNGLRVHAIHASHWLEGSLNQHVTKPMMALLEVGLVGTCGGARVAEIPFNHLLSCSKVNKMSMKGDSSLFVTTFQLYLIHFIYQV